MASVCSEPCSGAAAAGQVQYIRHRADLIHGGLQLISAAQFDPQIDAGWFAIGGANPRITDVDAAIGEPGEDVFEDADAIEHLNAKQHRITPAVFAHHGIPAHRQAPFHRCLRHVGAILAVNGDAVIAKGNGANNWLAR